MDMKYSALLVACLSLMVTSLCAQEATDTIAREYQLEEVLVRGENIVHKGDHDVLYLTKENRHFGTNALDAVSSLPLFQTRLNETTLMSWDQQNVYVLINGVPSSGMDLRAYKGEDIKRVEYYSIAPPQYMSLTSGPVVNVIMKKRHDRLYSGYFNTSNSVHTGFGTNQLDLTYADSLNQVKVGYYQDYRNTRNIDTETMLDYPSGNSSRYLGDKHYKWFSQHVTASYQRFQGNHLFNAKLSYSADPAQEVEPRTGYITSDAVDYRGVGQNRVKTNSKALVLDLYYRYLTKRKQTLAFNVVNTFRSSYSNSLQTMQAVPGGTGEYDYHLSSGQDNDVYSLIANIFFVSKLWGGTFAAGSRYEYRQLNQISAGQEYEPSSHNGLLNAGMSWRWGEFCFYPTVGAKVYRQQTSALSHTSVSPYIRLYTDWWGLKEKTKGMSVQLTLNLQNIAPSLGDLTASSTYLDRWLLAIGNPDLENFWKMSAKLALLYFIPDSKNQVALVSNFGYARKPVATTVVQQGEYTCLQSQHMDGDFEQSMSLFGSWFPFKWLEISPYLEFYISRFKTPSQRINWDYWRVGGSLVASFDNWAFSVYANSPTKVYSGDLLTRGSVQCAGVVQYKYKGWSFGAQYNYLGHNEYTLVQVPGFRYWDNEDWKPDHNLIRVNVTYTFSVGRARRHERSIFNESGKDTGLGKFNVPKGQ